MKPKNVEMLGHVNELLKYDHAFISADGVKHWAGIFNVKLRPTVHKSNPDHPKGLTLEGGASEAVGMDAADMAEQIAGQICGFRPWQMGRGFRLRSACEALRIYYQSKSIK